MSFRNYYDSSSYVRSRDTGRGAATAQDRHTTVTAKYVTPTSSYKSSSIPVLNTERNNKEETPISTIANRYANYSKLDKPTSKYDKKDFNDKITSKYEKKDYSDKSLSKYEKKDYAEKPNPKFEKKDYSDKVTSKYDKKDYSDKSKYEKKDYLDKSTSKYDKKDYSKLSIPSLTTNRSRDVSPVSSGSKYGSLTRPSRHLSPERRTKSYKDKSRDPSPTDREKDIPSKTDKSTGYNSLSSYKLYPRATNYTRPVAKPETKPEITVNRYAIANRLSSNYLRSPPTVKSSSVSPVNLTNTFKESSKREIDKSVSPNIISDESKQAQIETLKEKIVENGTDTIPEEQEANESETITVVTRHTSPTPPGSSAYVRMRRADMAKTVEKTVPKNKQKPEMVDKEIQSDRLDDPTRSSRFGSTARASVSNWSFYTPNANSYTGYAGRYSTQYSNLREPGSGHSDRSSRSQSSEPQVKETSSSISLSDSNKDKGKNSPLTLNNIPESNQEIINMYELNKDDDTSEIIINVNLKLKKAKSPVSITSAELVSPEITITNSQLPPQAPKAEGVPKTKKLKTRKSSTDSSSDSGSKKKVVKKRSKSVSSTDSDQINEVNDQKGIEGKSPPKSLPKPPSTTNLQNGHAKLKHSKSRESNSPDSSVTLSTQSSLSEDESVTKSKTNDVSRTSADEISIPTDRSAKQTSPIAAQKNDTDTEEAKSFLIRALAPVTNLFKRHQETSDSKNYPENSTSESTGKDVSNLITESDKSGKSKNNTDNIIASNDDHVVKLKAIRHIESGERAWWMDPEPGKQASSQSLENKMSSEKNIQRKIKHIESDERAWWLDPNSESKSEKQIQKSNATETSEPNQLPPKYKPTDDERPWWLDSSANIPEGIERLTPPRKSSSDSDKSEKFNVYKVRRFDSGDKKDWWATSNENSSNSNSKSDAQNNLSKSGSQSDKKSFSLRRIRHIESGERPWWLSSDKNIPEGIERLPTPPPEDSDSSDSDEVQVYIPSAQIPPFPLHLPDDEPLGARRSPEGLETPKQNEDYERGRASPYENNRQFRRRSSANNMSYQKGAEKYISRYTDIDDILGTSGHVYSPFMDSILARRTGQMPFDDDECEEIDPTQVRIHDSTAQRGVLKKLRGRGETVDYCNEDQLDDATLQVFKDGDYGPYLDLDCTLREQDEDLEGLQDSRKNALVLRTQLSVRVHAIIERLLHSQGRELRRALFTLKQILQSDKDLIHEFVANKGLDCLMQVSSMADHNYLDYILRALGQILLYIDGMHGVMAHKRCVQWLYSLISSNYRHVVKTALKLLLVFVEYTEKNCLLLIDAVHVTDTANGKQPWYNVMKILQDFDASDTELLIYATTLINRCLINVPDRDAYYDQVDALQDQGMDHIIQLYMSKQGTDLDLLRQLQIFEAVLLHEDGDDTGTALKQLDESIIGSVRRRSINLNSSERRKSKKQEMKEKANPASVLPNDAESNGTNHVSPFPPSIIDNKENKELTTALQRRRDRFARQKHLIIQQQELVLINQKNSQTNGLLVNNGSYTGANGNYSSNDGNVNASDNYIDDVNGTHQQDPAYASITTKKSNLEDVFKNGNQRFTPGLKQRIQNGTLGHSVSAVDAITVMRQKQIDAPEVNDDRVILLNREHSIKDLAQRLTSPVSPTTEEKPLRVSEMAGIVSKAKEELAKSQSKEVIKSPTKEIAPKIHEIKVSENDLHWEELRKGCMNRDYRPCDPDFIDLLQDSDDDDITCPAVNAASGPPPPPPGMFPGGAGCLPPMPGCGPPPPFRAPAPPMNPSLSSEMSNDSDSSTMRKNKKTVKLFWREIQENPVPPPFRSKVGGLIWDSLPDISLDTKMLEHLFEAKTNDLIIKKLMEPKRNLILDTKRSNAINIAMKKLPTPQTIKAAIMKMDASSIGREGIEKLLTMLPTEEEKVKIQEAQYANPDLPLGSAEQFLLTLASISELSSRLKLWVFKLDFDNLEKEISEPLKDLKLGIDILRSSYTFKAILTTLRSVGSFLNGSQVKGFRLDYLSKVMEVKDTVHKHPLLYHICEMIIDKFKDTTDFFTEIGPISRASKADFDSLSANLMKLEVDCKASWDHMKRISKHDSSQILTTKINEFLTDAAERIILLTIIEKRVMNRYHKFLLYLGVPPADCSKTKPSDFLKVIADFSLEYRTTRERVLLQLQKRAEHRERNKTRGKMIMHPGNLTTKTGDLAADCALKELLKTNSDTDSPDKMRRKSQHLKQNKPLVNGDLSPEDEIIASLVRSATAKRAPASRERRRNRIADNNHLNRTLGGAQSWPGRENSPGSNVQHR